MKRFTKVTEDTNFYQGLNPANLIKEYGSPLYVYNEKILRNNCRKIKNLVSYENFHVSYSAKANSNLHIMEIVKEEGLDVDAMSQGEIFVQLKAGFKKEQIFFVSNNISKEEMAYAINQGVRVSVDSISQLKLFGELNPGGEVAIRFNPGIGAGHHKKVITAGKETKFGIDPIYIDEVKSILKEYKLKLIGINQHIGSLFMDGAAYLESVKAIFSLADSFEGLSFVDIGGGFGIPYKKQEGQLPLDLVNLGEKLNKIIEAWTASYGKRIQVRIEPGRFVPAEASVLLGTVQAVKENYGKKYIGTDIGFNVLARPILYNSHHDIEVYKEGKVAQEAEVEKVTVVGNICESGDIISENTSLPRLREGDILGILDAGAYGYVMSSNYNNRLRPAEVLIREDGSVKLIRRRDTLEDLLRNY
jgi:diaminopimelate decarboxylase